MTKDPGFNVGIRDAAKLAGVSHTRVGQVLADLARAGLVDRHETRWGPVFDLNMDHYFAPQLFHLFDDELHFFQSVEGFLKGEARKTRRQIRVQTSHHTAGVDLGISIKALHPSREDDLRWLDEMEDAMAERFGLKVRIEAN